MPTRNLDKLFAPKSIAVIGASNRPNAVGTVVMKNLLQGGFDGPIMPVNPKRSSVSAVLTYPDVKSLPITPDLAVICIPPAQVPGAVKELAERGTRAVVCLTAGLGGVVDDQGRKMSDLLMETARQYGVRILGPNCVGLLVPGVGLNASFAHVPAEPGKIAFVSQSGALCTAVLDWARAHDIGFSHFISLGDAADLDFGDVIDYLGSDPQVRAILLYIESIKERRNFMSAARAAARNKPLIVIKSGRAPEGAAAAASHTGALAGSDDVYDAAFKRAGMLRVHNFIELFGAVETLARSKPLKGESLAIMTNGGGVGVMAVDDLIEGGGKLAKLSDETIAKLDAVLPANWSKGNPVDIIGDAPGERYAAAAEILCQAKEVDALLVMQAPVATASTTDAANAVIEAAKKSKTNVLTSWVGEEAVASARRMFIEAGIPTYDTPGQAVTAFLHMVNYRKNQEMLMETPPSMPMNFTPATETARILIQHQLAAKTDMMSEPDAKAVLAAYGIPVVETHICRATPEDAADKADEIGYPVVIKILSDDISHKSDVGGVALRLEDRETVLKAAAHMLDRIRKKLPDADLEGFSVQKMAERPRAHELIVGVNTDPIFGPVILFGQGGTAVEVIKDSAIALPPLNMNLAKDLVSGTRIYKLLQGYRDIPSVDMDALCTALTQIAQLVIDIPEIKELDINPLFCDEKGVLALDARIRVASVGKGAQSRLAIRPYPKDLEEEFELRSGREVLIRPIRPEDEPAHHAFISKLSPEDIRFRFFGLVRELPHTEMARLTQIDYDREMAFIATAPDENGKPETLGVVRTVTDPNNDTAEYAVVVRSDLKGQKLGWKLLDKMIQYCRARGTKYFAGQVLRENRKMLDMVQSMGFELGNLEGEDGVKAVKLKL